MLEQDVVRNHVIQVDADVLVCSIGLQGIA